MDKMVSIIYQHVILYFCCQGLPTPYALSHGSGAGAHTYIYQITPSKTLLATLRVNVVTD